MRALEILSTLGLLVLVTGCRLEAPSPSGFAVYDGFGPLRAVSPDGVLYRVRSEDNEPLADLEFWRQALRRHMVDAGYRLLDEGDVEADGVNGYLLELAAPLGEQDYAYLVALFVVGDELILAEAAGEVTRFQARREAIVEAVRTIEL
jgi:hypothetical protein